MLEALKPCNVLLSFLWKLQRYRWWSDKYATCIRWPRSRKPRRRRRCHHLPIFVFRLVDTRCSTGRCKWALCFYFIQLWMTPFSEHLYIPNKNSAAEILIGNMTAAMVRRRLYIPSGFFRHRCVAQPHEVAGERRRHGWFAVPLPSPTPRHDHCLDPWAGARRKGLAVVSSLYIGMALTLGAYSCLPTEHLTVIAFWKHLDLKLFRFSFS